MYERLVIFLKYKNIKIGIKIPITFRQRPNDLKISTL